MPPIIIGITGASGAALAKGCVEKLVEKGTEVIVLCTPAGQIVWQHELQSSFRQWVKGLPCRTYNIRDIAAPIASGTYPTSGMAVVPCSMGTMAAIAHGLSQNLLERAVDVTIKEGRPLVLVPRESPLSVIHLTNLLTLAKLGAKIVPPMPPFYTRPERVDQVVEHVVGRILIALGIETELPPDQRYENGLARDGKGVPNL